VNKKILFLILLAVVLVPTVTFAQQDLQTIVDTAASSLVALAAGLATISFIVSGIMFLTATGNPGRMGIAKTALIAAVIGIIVIVLAEGAKTFVSTFFGL
jgi:FtsH-binding integral membrane protein